MRRVGQDAFDLVPEAKPREAADAKCVIEASGLLARTYARLRVCIERRRRDDPD